MIHSNYYGLYFTTETIISYQTKNMKFLYKYTIYFAVLFLFFRLNKTNNCMFFFHIDITIFLDSKSEIINLINNEKLIKNFVYS